MLGMMLSVAGRCFGGVAVHVAGGDGARQRAAGGAGRFGRGGVFGRGELFLMVVLCALGGVRIILLSDRETAAIGRTDAALPNRRPPLVRGDEVQRGARI